MKQLYSDLYFESEDGLTLYARDYSFPQSEHTILCLHGLTRNSADFADFCAAMYPRHRFIVPDQRGRGLSAYDTNTDNYHPARYARDMFNLLDLLSLDKVILIGTSMGGLMAMLMAAMQPERFRAVVLNDIGPDIQQDGLERIKAYASQATDFSSWQEAVDHIKQVNKPAFPAYTDEQWLNFAHNLCLEKDGQPVLAYDRRIMEPILRSDGAAAPQDLWPVFAASACLPMCVVRGEYSDILSLSCVEKMRENKMDLHVIHVPEVGHAPMLSEIEVLAPLHDFIASIGQSGE